MSYFVAPEKGLTIAFFQGGEATSRPERFPYVTDGSLHSPFLISGADRAGPGQENGDEAQNSRSRGWKRIHHRDVETRRLFIVIQSDAGHAPDQDSKPCTCPRRRFSIV